MKENELTHELKAVWHRINDDEGVMDVMGSTTGEKKEAKNVAQIALGSGYVLWVKSEFKCDALLLDQIDAIIDEASAHPIQLGTTLKGKIKKLIQLHEEMDKIAKEVQQALDSRYELGIDENMMDPLRYISSDFIVSGVEKEEHGKKRLFVKGHRTATQQTKDGIYVWQQAGYCEDDYSGEQFIHFEGNTYLCLPFEF